ncbi:MAG: preprotein translocase subunit SecE [Candidatus Saccharibacteria bacterium]
MVFLKKKKSKKEATPKKESKFLKVIQKRFSWLIKFGGYFKGSWKELRQVRWPDRKATWGMTAAVLLFTGFFALLILLLDAGFNELFKLIIK